MKYIVRLLDDAIKDLELLDYSIVKRIKNFIEKLSNYPNISGIKPLKRYSNISQYLSLNEEIYRLKVGDYRVLFYVDDENKIINIIAVGHRSKIYDE